MLLTPWWDWGKSRFFPGDRVRGALSQVGMQDWAFPSWWLIPMWGCLCLGPLFQLWLAQRRAGLCMCPYGSCTIVTVLRPDLTYTHLAEGEAPRRDPAPREVVSLGLWLLEPPQLAGEDLPGDPI